MVVRSVLIRWFASYLNERSHFTQFGKEASDFVNINGGVPQRPIAFVIKINMLPSVIEQVVAQGVKRLPVPSWVDVCFGSPCFAL